MGPANQDDGKADGDLDCTAVGNVDESALPGPVEGGAAGSAKMQANLVESPSSREQAGQRLDPDYLRRRKAKKRARQRA